MDEHSEPPTIRLPSGQQDTPDTERFSQTDRRTFSRLVQCRTSIQTREHVIKQCKKHTRHRLILGHGRHAQLGRLMGTVKGIRKLSTFVKRSGAFNKDDSNLTHEREKWKRERRSEHHMRIHQTTIPPPAKTYYICRMFHM